MVDPQGGFVLDERFRSCAIIHLGQQAPP
jgi:hypothetical protein